MITQAHYAKLLKIIWLKLISVCDNAHSHAVSIYRCIHTSELGLDLNWDWTSSGLWVKCDVSVQYFGQNFIKQAANSYFTIATSPSPVQFQSDCVNIWSSPIRILSQPTSIRWIRIQSKFSPNPIQLRSHLWTRYPNLVQIRPESAAWTHLMCKSKWLKH